MEKIKTTKKNFIEVRDWDDLVTKTYGRPYNFQQQYGCQDRGIHNLTIPSSDPDEFENDSVPEIVNGDEMGVKFEAWLARDPKQKIKGQDASFTDMWWERNFYPDIQMVANDLYKKGLIEAGDYTINIDW